MFRLLLLVVCMSVGRCHTGNGTSILSRMPEIVQQLCPGANICPENHTLHAHENEFLPGYGSCCVDCSCSSECEENGDCCFTNKPNNQDEGNILQKEHICLFPVTPEPPLEIERTLLQSYSMVSSIPGKGHVSMIPASSVPCGERNAAPWGSLYPVYSAKSKQIYKNSACAAEDGVTDVVHWDAVLFCHDIVAGITLDAGSFVLGLDSDSINNECVVQFVFPGNIDDIRALKCYKDTINNCPDSDFRIPDETEITKEDVIEMCTSGLMSPFRAGRLYANVFCYICDNRFFKREMKCRNNNALDRGPETGGFIGLIDETFINEDLTKTTRHISNLPKACGIGKSAACRPVHCPSGQLRGKTGNVYIQPNYGMIKSTTYTLTSLLKQPTTLQFYKTPKRGICQLLYHHGEMNG